MSMRDAGIENAYKSAAGGSETQIQSGSRTVNIHTFASIDVCPISSSSPSSPPPLPPFSTPAPPVPPSTSTPHPPPAAPTASSSAPPTPCPQPCRICARRQHHRRTVVVAARARMVARAPDRALPSLLHLLHAPPAHSQLNGAREHTPEMQAGFGSDLSRRASTLDVHMNKTFDL